MCGLHLCALIRCLRAWPTASVVLQVPDALAQVHGKSQERLGETYLHDPTLCETSRHVPEDSYF